MSKKIDMEDSFRYWLSSGSYSLGNKILMNSNKENNMEDEKTEKLNLRIERLSTGYILTENYDHAFFRPERHAFSTKASLKKKIEKLVEELA